MREVHLMQELHSPYVVRYYDSFMRQTEDGDQLCIVSELCETDLQKFLEDRREPTYRLLTEDEVWPLFIRAAAGLYAVHQRGIIHRDLKPNNFLLVGLLAHPPRPLVKLTDFGLAKRAMNQSETQSYVKGAGVVPQP